MTKPSLVVLAAGMGSRYGSLKQMDGVGPNAETIIDYSVYDAIKAGFGKVVFVIREDFAEDFKAKVGNKFAEKIDVRYAFQAIDSPIEGLDDIPHREKPWGTAHAMLVAQDQVEEPFAVINADDYYGRDSFKVIADFLATATTADTCAMVGYVLRNTLSDHGTVNRGVAEMNEDNELVDVVERLKIAKDGDTATYLENEERFPLKIDSLVSMNFWGFHPSIFELTRKLFLKFVEENRDSPRAEFFIPLVVNSMINDDGGKCLVLDTDEQWYGVTYKEDKPFVTKAMQEMVTAGRYPSPLWG